MKGKKYFISVFLLILVGSFVLIPRADAATPIATISAFDGDVSILSDYKIKKVTQAGQVLNQGDRVQVKVGFATVTFNDGATLNVNPYSSTLIQEQEEETGWWVFKVKKTVRRITCFIGKLKFKSGKSIQDNYLQTPTAVAGLRGTEAEVGYDNANNYLNMISGELAVTYGEFLRGFFENPGVNAATQNQVFQALEAAAAASQAAAPGDSQAQQAAQIAALQAIQAAAQAMTNNPDPVVQQQAQQVVTQTQQQITDVQSGQLLAPPTTAAPPTTVPTTITTTTTTTTTTTSSTTTTTQYIK